MHYLAIKSLNVATALICSLFFSYYLLSTVLDVAISCGTWLSCEGKNYKKMFLLQFVIITHVSLISGLQFKMKVNFYDIMLTLTEWEGKVVLLTRKSNLFERMSFLLFTIYVVLKILSLVRSDQKGFVFWWNNIVVELNFSLITFVGNVNLFLMRVSYPTLLTWQMKKMIRYL